MSEQTGHTLHAAISEGYLHLEVKCHEGVNAPCRRMCVKGCDEICSDPDKHFEDTGECGAIEWINADSVDECYEGERRPIYDGMPIEVDWTGDTWTWTIAEPASAERTALTSPVGSMLQ